MWVTDSQEYIKNDGITTTKLCTYFMGHAVRYAGCITIIGTCDFRCTASSLHTKHCWHALLQIYTLRAPIFCKHQCDSLSDYQGYFSMQIFVRVWYHPPFRNSAARTLFIQRMLFKVITANPFTTPCLLTPYNGSTNIKRQTFSGSVYKICY